MTYVDGDPGHLAEHNALHALAGAWTAYTPTISGTGWAIGNGTTSATYLQVGKTVFVRVKVTFGTTSTFGASILAISAPVAVAADSPMMASLVDTSLGQRFFGLAFGTGSSFVMLTEPAAAAGPQRAVVTAVPFAWASTDTVTINGSYEAA